MPTTVLVEEYWSEISADLAQHAARVRYFVLSADQETLRRRIEGDTVLGPFPFRPTYLEPSAEAARTWLHDEAEGVDTTHLTPASSGHPMAITTAETHAIHLSRRTADIRDIRALAGHKRGPENINVPRPFDS